MDPLSLSAFVVGIISLALERTEILTTFTTTVVSAASEASSLKIEITTLTHVLETLVSILRSDDFDGATFERHSILCSVVSACQKHIAGLYKKLEEGLEKILAWILPLDPNKRHHDFRSKLLEDTGK
ncbi:hypothetical protein FPQ18DRAFT_388270 [Pyronema domesticum]|uniref:Fungal N-terminal domain-containing protein n=1 Tax=Pyronema omphalodes (strain CBS 100304) TaxID=1076935 RepID=U4LC00_PYROM|nr:hypothetical protein FPQ18DRAFT_388270 [Pyronema domesticum]CCX29629.1 Protein of unknown function [Pyronema omphalodes CBS 100304]